MATRRIALAVIATASTAGFLLAGCGSAAPASPVASTTTAASSEAAPATVVMTVTAPPPVTVTATPTPPVTVTEQGPPIIISPQQDPTTVYQYSPAYTSVFDLPSGLYCRDLKAMGYSYSQATSYWYYHGRPAMMDADLNGIPCETVY